VIGASAGEGEYAHVEVQDFEVPQGFEVKLWAQSPMFYNPTNMDVDYKGRVWVAEGRNYRMFRNRSVSAQDPKGDRIMVLSDTDGDGAADQSHVFVQDPELIAPLGVAVIGNKVVVSQPPSVIVYHDVNHDAVFDATVDKKEILLTGFGGVDHDHSLHAVTAGPSGQWYFNIGNAGTHLLTDKDGFTVKIGSSYRGGSPSVSKPGPHQGGKPGLVSDDGHVYVGSAVIRINPDGTGMRVVAHNMRNSYEETVSSYGDVFQNDNDDPPACRTTWVMEYGNLGFASDDGKRSWKIDRRPGQTTAIAEWRQEDPGKIPAGDVYGSGSPTGITYYENGALGEKWEGLLLSCEAAHNVVFGYFPTPKGAGFELERFNFLKSKARKGAKYSPNNFRPSDVTVGPDGSIFVADWYDGGVGGHKMSDKQCAGAIYRIVPTGLNPQTPKIDLTQTEGLIAALKSPAINVRNNGFTGLKAQGEAAIPAVAALLEEENQYFQARAIWLLPQLGDAGVEKVKALMSSTTDAQTKIVCFRSLRFVGQDVVALAQQLVNDTAMSVRRELALIFRDRSWEESKEVLIALAQQYDGEDRWYLEAIGTGATNKEKELYAHFRALPENAEPLKWSAQMTQLAWRLHPEASVADLRERALSDALTKVERYAMLTALGHIPTREAALAVVDVAADGPEDTKVMASWWLNSLSSSSWKGYSSEMRGLNVDKSRLPANTNYVVPVDSPPVTDLKVEDVLKLKGDYEKGKIGIARCYMCHQIGGNGVDFGPNLDGWGAGRSKEAIATALIHPNAAVAHGFEAYEIKTKAGHLIQGINMGAQGKTHVVRVMGGADVGVDAHDIADKGKPGKSLMLSVGQLGLKEQEVADIIAYLKGKPKAE